MFHRPIVRSAVAPVVAAVLLLSNFAAAQVDYDKRIADAKTKAIAFLLSKQSQKTRVVRLIKQSMEVSDVDAKTFTVNGTSVRAGGQAFNDVYAVLPPGWIDPDPVGDQDVLNAGGSTALVALALLSCGVDPNRDARLAQAIACLDGMYTADMGGQVIRNLGGRTLKKGAQGTYALSLHAVLLHELFQRERQGPKKVAYRKALEAVSKKVETGFRADGGYDYFLKGSDRWDMSNTQYAMLALAAANEVTAEVSPKTLTHLNNFYVTTQNSDGGWPYTKPGESSMNMTAGAVASTMLIVDMLHTRGRSKPEVNPFAKGTLPGKTVESAARGLEYFGRNFHLDLDGYLLYSAERIGQAGGYKRFGSTDWLKEGVDLLLKGQAADGSWPLPAGRRHFGDVNINTAFCLLFLSHGYTPVLVNKLRWGGANDYRWNNYPRDCANLTRWFNRTFEQNVGWQIVGFEHAPDFDDAPILYISGAERPQFTDGQLDDLRRYVNRGGTLLCVAVNGNKGFIDGITDLGRNLYPAFEYPDHQLTKVPPDHPVFILRSGERNVSKIPVYHIHNGARSVLFLVTEDIAWAWNSGRAAASNEYMFSLVSNLRHYATDTGKLPPKIKVSIEPLDEPEKLTGFSLGVLKYTSAGSVDIQGPADTKPSKVTTLSDWASAPESWESFVPWFQRVCGFNLFITRGIAPTDPALGKQNFVHMVGRQPLALSADEQAALKLYLERGGTIIVEDVGSLGADRRFFASAVKHFQSMYPKAPAVELPAEHPIFTGKFAKSPGGVKDPGFSRAIRRDEPKTDKPQLFAITINGRPAVFLSKYDFSTAITGSVQWQRWGYGQQAAREIVGNILLYVRAFKTKEL